MKIQRTKWAERKFNFDYPVGMFPYFLERLRGTLPRIEEIIKNIPEKKLEQKSNDTWSVKEHIGHLIDLEELHEGRFEDFKNELKTLRAADMTNKKTNETKHNSVSVDDLISSFRKARNHFISEFENKSEKELVATATHPRLNQPMRLVDMAFFVAEHDDLHLTMMREIIS